MHPEVSRPSATPTRRSSLWRTHPPRRYSKRTSWPVLLTSDRTPEIKKAIESLNISGPLSCILVGIESHICITQTAIDLMKAGHKVYVIADGVSSCNKEEVPIALARLRHEGAIVTTSESFVYECVGDAGSPEYVQFFHLFFNPFLLPFLLWCRIASKLILCRFKQIIKVVKDTSQSTKDVLQTLCKI